MNIVSIDPGFTTGIVVARLAWNDLHLSNFGHCKSISFADEEMYMQATVAMLAAIGKPERLVIEDYRIFPQMARMHSGHRPAVSELIGAIHLHCELNQIPFYRVSPSQKGRWPLARLKNKFPQHKKVPRPHALAALQVLLVHLEQEGLWKP